MGIERLKLPTLKEKAIKKSQDVKETHSKMKANIKQIKTNQSISKIPKSVIDRYDKQFSHNRTEVALKHTIIAFFIIFCLLLFFQPGLAPTMNFPGIVNLTNHEITNITLTNVTNPSNQVFESSLESQKSKEFKLESGIYLVTATKQFPVILIMPGTEPEKIKNPLEQKIEDEKEGI
jgi:hypothetical protein